MICGSSRGSGISHLLALGKLWFLFTLAVFIASQSVLGRMSGDREQSNIAIVVCRIEIISVNYLEPNKSFKLG